MGTTLCTCVDENNRNISELGVANTRRSEYEELRDQVHSVHNSDRDHKEELDSILKSDISGLSNITPDNRATRLLKKQDTSELERRQTADESTDKSFKKTVSFFSYNSSDKNGKYNPSLIDLTNPKFGEDWSVQNIKLDKCLKSVSGSKYVWEGTNTLLKQSCLVTVLVYDYAKLQNSNFSKTVTILKELLDMDNPNIAKFYSASIFDTRNSGKIYYRITLVQELTRCNLGDLNIYRIQKRQSWKEEELMPIVCDIFDGLCLAKANDLTHQELKMHNITFSQKLDRVVLYAFDLRIPLLLNNKNGNLQQTTPLKSAFAKSHLKASPTLKRDEIISSFSRQHFPDKENLKSLVAIMLQLSLKLENLPEDPEEILEENEILINEYPQLHQLLTQLISRDEELLKGAEQDIMDYQKKNKQRVIPKIPETASLRTYDRNHSQADRQKKLIETYEWVKNYHRVLELHLASLTDIEKRGVNSVEDKTEHITLLNKALKTYIAIKIYNKAFDLSKKITPLIKNDPSYKNLIKQNPAQYISLTFSLGAINEGLNKLDAAIKFYNKGLGLCLRSNMTLENYPEALRRLSNLFSGKGNHVKAFEYLKKLADHYETKTDKYFLEKTDVFFNLGDIACKFGDFGKAVKQYTKSLDYLKKAKPEDKPAQLDLVESIAERYLKLNNYEYALKFFKDAMELRKEVFGPASPEYTSSTLRVGD